jgi:hypothetical protein
MALLDHVKYSNGNDSDQRALAVNAALELIAVRVGATSPNGNHLDVELNRLSQYADKIQEALKTK